MIVAANSILCLMLYLNISGNSGYLHILPVILSVNIQIVLVCDLCLNCLFCKDCLLFI